LILFATVTRKTLAYCLVEDDDGEAALVIAFRDVAAEIKAGDRVEVEPLRLCYRAFVLGECAACAGLVPCNAAQRMVSGAAPQPLFGQIRTHLFHVEYLAIVRVAP
jgi:hypothetical protein